jgi:hypothetical protein
MKKHKQQLFSNDEHLLQETPVKASIHWKL